DPSRAFWIALSVLVVSCPCALGLATPIAITNATTALRRLGLLVARSDAWENLPRVTDIVFDKTGTLSEGRVRLAEIVALGGRDPAVCRQMAAALESGSAHPIAHAFTDGFGGGAAQSQQFTTGAGVEGWIAGRRYRLGLPAFALNDAPTVPDGSGHWLLLADEHGALCWFRIDDRAREDAADTVAALQRSGYRVHLLSGDHSGAVATLAAELGITDAIAGA